MTLANRPTAITTILRNLDSGGDAALSANLEAYIAELESRQQDRPAHITAILQKIGSQYADMGLTLETYLSNLEANQQLIQTETPAWDEENPPVWSHERAMQRKHHRQERALRKWRQQNRYQ